MQLINPGKAESSWETADTKGSCSMAGSDTQARTLHAHMKGTPRCVTNEDQRLALYIIPHAGRKASRGSQRACSNTGGREWWEEYQQYLATKVVDQSRSSMVTDCLHLTGGEVPDRRVRAVSSYRVLRC